jgi:hypothetical protein
MNGRRPDPFAGVSATAVALDFNPTELEPDRIYLQVVSNGVVALPAFDRSAKRWPVRRRLGRKTWKNQRLRMNDQVILILKIMIRSFRDFRR